MKQRIGLLDGLRGYFLLLMMINHLGGDWNRTLLEHSHHGWGFVEDAQFFVFLSGLVVGLVYTAQLGHAGLDHVSNRVFKRMRLIYIYHVIVTVLIMAIVYLSPVSEGLVALSQLGSEAQWVDFILTILLLTGPTFVDILPMYVVFMIATPFILAQLNQGRTIAVLCTSVFLWTVAQTELIGYLFLVANDALGLTPAKGLQLGMYFDRMAWQVLFVWGLCIGFHFERGTITLDFLTTKQGDFLAWLSFILILCFAIIRNHTSAAYGFFPTLEGGFDRQNFSVLRLANFVGELFLFVWLIVAAPTRGWWVFRKISQGLRWIFTTEFLCLLGRHSLQVYAYHVVLIYVVNAVIDWSAPQSHTKDIVLFLAALTIHIPALAHARYQKWISRSV